MTEQPYTPPAHQLATFDQIYAALGESLDSLIDVHRTVLSEPDLPREVNITGLCAYLADNFEPVALAELLATAIDRLASQKADEA